VDAAGVDNEWVEANDTSDVDLHKCIIKYININAPILQGHENPVLLRQNRINLLHVTVGSALARYFSAVVALHDAPLRSPKLHR
jgi:hypothetical protein